MTLETLLEILHAGGLSVGFDKPNTISVGPRSALNPELKQAIKKWKPTILGFIQHQPESHREFSCLLYCSPENGLSTFCVQCGQRVGETTGCRCYTCNQDRDFEPEETASTGEIRQDVRRQA
jgi:hypothetical protein